MQSLIMGDSAPASIVKTIVTIINSQLNERYVVCTCITIVITKYIFLHMPVSTNAIYLLTIVLLLKE